MDQELTRKCCERLEEFSGEQQVSVFVHSGHKQFWVNLKHILVAESDQLCEISLASHSFMETNLVKANCWNFVGDTTKVIRIFVGQ